MREVPIKFPGDFESDAAAPIHLGRLYVGEHLVRVFFSPRGQMHLALPQAAIDDGSVIVTPPIDTTIITFGVSPEKGNAMEDLPQYKCHKTVRAAKITAILDGGELALEGNHRVRPGLGWMNKHHPEVGQYFVVYEDGYQSVSPAKTFNEGYTLVE